MSCRDPQYLSDFSPFPPSSSCFHPQGAPHHLSLPRTCPLYLQASMGPTPCSYPGPHHTPLPWPRPSCLSPSCAQCACSPLSRRELGGEGGRLRFHSSPGGSETTELKHHCSGPPAWEMTSQSHPSREGRGQESHYANMRPSKAVPLQERVVRVKNAAADQRVRRSLRTGPVPAGPDQQKGLRSRLRGAGLRRGDGKPPLGPRPEPGRATWLA